MLNKLTYLAIAIFFLTLTNDLRSQMFIDSDQNLGNGATFSIALGDLDGDNTPDAVVVDYLSDTKIWFNNGQGQFTYSGQSFGTPSNQGHGAAIGDLDGDGDNDIFIVNNNASNIILINNGNGVFYDSEQVLGGPDDKYISAILIDVDGDTDLDALVASNLHHGELWINDGSGSFINSGQNIGNNEAFYMGVGDLDGDTDPDIILNNLNKYDEVLFNDGNGNFTNSGQSIGDSLSWGHVALSDIDNDGDFDVFIGNHGSGICKIWVNDGMGNFSEYSNYPENGECIAIEDLDNDGDMDAITCGFQRFIKIWMNDGTGNFSCLDSLDYEGISVSLADVDNDSDIDVAIGFFQGPEGNKIYINQTLTGVNDNFFEPTGYLMLQNFPNPFINTTKIKYTIPENMFVTLQVYDILGNKISSLVEEKMQVGTHEIEFSATWLPAGIYTYRLQTENFTQSKKMFLTK